MPRQSSQSQSKPALMVKPRSPTIVHTHPQTAGFGQLIKEGIGFGAGSAIAQRAITAILGPQTFATVSSETKTPCLSERNIFEVCMRSQNECNNEYLSYSHCIKLNQKEQ